MAEDIIDVVGKNVLKAGAAAKDAINWGKRGITAAGAALNKGMQTALDTAKPKPAKPEDVGTGGANQMGKNILSNAKEAEKIK